MPRLWSEFPVAILDSETVNRYDSVFQNAPVEDRRGECTSFWRGRIRSGMATKSTIERMKKVEALVKKHEAKRAELKAKGDLAALDKLPRNSSRVRLRRLCALTGRPRGVYRKFKLARHQLRDMALDGLIPGMKKASW